MIKDKGKTFFITILFLVLAIGLAITAPWQMSYDAARFMLPWLDNMKVNGILAMYKPVELAPFPMDYPPLYYSLMYIFTNNFLDLSNTQQSVVVIRLFAVIINLLFIYFLIKFVDKKMGIAYAFFIPTLIGSAVWAQSDSFFIFLFFLFFYSYYKKNNITLMSIIYALMVCLKLQGLYFLPVYLVLLFGSKNDKTEKVNAFIYGIVVGAIIWLPWLIVEGPGLFFKIYLGSAAQEAIWGMGGNFPFVISFFAGIRTMPVVGELKTLYTLINIYTLLLCVALFIWLLNRSKDILYTTAFYLFMIFMLTLHQYERYEIYTWGVLFFIVSTNFKYQEYSDDRQKRIKRIFVLISLANILNFTAPILLNPYNNLLLIGTYMYLFAFVINVCALIIFVLDISSFINRNKEGGII